MVGYAADVWANCKLSATFNTYSYYMAEVVHGEKEHSDWFPE